MVGRTVSHYRIVEELGAGGMGVVYKAEDTRLGRAVALKFLPEHLASDRGALERFRREARAASALNHPHICTIYDIDEAAPSTGSGQAAPFIAMELLEGESLRARLAQTRLAVPALIDIGIQLADALDAAHAKGIVHRDIKPENVFITTRGTAKLLDFGIAKLVTEQAAVTAALTATRVGTGPVALGTVAYMSPEQVRGEMLDARTDLFSLGVVLYELATGTQPFRGTTSGAVVGEILTKAPTAPVRLNPEVPPELDRIVNKLLEKDRELRYQWAKDLRVDLERLRRTLTASRHETVPAATEEASIVVLPFNNLSPDPDNAFFADGLTEEIITDLSKVRALRVISRTSAMLLKGARKDLPTIGRELNVRYVLEGSVRRAGNHLRITAQLIEAATDAHLWAEKYTGTLDDVFEIQEKLSRTIVDALKVRLTPEEDQRLAARSIPDASAYDCYLRAWRDTMTFTEVGLARALQATSRALDIVGENPLLYATLALVHWQYHNAGIKVDEETLRQADAFAAKALALDPDLPAGWFARGSIAYTRGDFPAAVRYYHEATRLQPHSEALAFLCHVCGLSGRIEEGRHYGDRALTVDPLNPWAHLCRANVELFAGAPGAALGRYADGLRAAPDDAMLLMFHAVATAQCGDEKRAVCLFEEMAPRLGGALSSMCRMWVAALGGRVEEVAALGDHVRAYGRRDTEISWWLADCFAAIGRVDDAVDWIENAVRRGFVNHRFFSEGDRFLAPLRGYPPFEALMERAREKERAFQV